MTSIKPHELSYEQRQRIVAFDRAQKSAAAALANEEVTARLGADLVGRLATTNADLFLPNVRDGVAKPPKHIEPLRPALVPILPNELNGAGVDIGPMLGDLTLLDSDNTKSGMPRRNPFSASSESEREVINCDVLRPGIGMVTCHHSLTCVSKYPLVDKDAVYQSRAVVVSSTRMILDHSQAFAGTVLAHELQHVDDSQSGESRSVDLAARAVAELRAYHVENAISRVLIRQMSLEEVRMGLTSYVVEPLWQKYCSAGVPFELDSGLVDKMTKLGALSSNSTSTLINLTSGEAKLAVG